MSTSNPQFISHFNAKGLRGNITFNVEGLADAKVLVVESIIEEVKLAYISDITINSQAIYFDWDIYSSTLLHNAIYSCSNDDLGSVMLDDLRKNLPGSKQIALNRPNRWVVPLSNVLNHFSAPNLSSLIWGKSIRLKLSGIHSEESRGESGKASSSNSLIRPQLNQVTATNTVQRDRPTFAPRPKPSISNKTKANAPITLPKSESLFAAGNLSTLDENTLPEPHPQQSVVNPNDPSLSKDIVKLYGKSILCANIIDIRNVKSARATFESQIAGTVEFRGNEDEVTIIMPNLYHVKSKVTTQHQWKILASDILDNRRHEEECKYLQLLLDPNNTEDSKCAKTNHDSCRMGDLTGKHGQIRVAGQGKSTRTIFTDLNLPLSVLEGSRSLFLVIYELTGSLKTNSNEKSLSILSCAQIKSVNSRTIEASFNMDGVRGSVRMFQRHQTEPTSITYDLFGLEGNIKHQTIRELPLAARSSTDNSKLCNELGGIFNPFKMHENAETMYSTVDMYPVGNLSAKHGQLSVIDSEYEDHYMGEYTDLSIQLQGLNSVVGRSILIHKNNGEPWVCATLNHLDAPINLAVATFHYPVVGRISFQQLETDPHSETGVLVELFNPNGSKDSTDHNWMVHLKPAMADFYNWSERCQSSGEVFDPIQASVGISNDAYNRQCHTSLANEPLRCRLGDLSAKSGFKLTLPLSPLNRTRYYYVDNFLPLSKMNMIIGRSVVIYDDNSPTQRGNRLACSSIKLIHPLKAVIKSWDSGPSIPSAIQGTVMFEQESEARATKIKVDLGGFNGNVENFAIHHVWTMNDREFPCSNDSLYDIYDPFDTENSLRLPPSAHYGTLATVDRVKVGDLSRKHGTFEGLQSVKKFYTDANAPLFAPNSIIGRSMVLRAAVNNFRWVCGNIELDYDRRESREVIGIASFDEPRSKIAGYVRFIQLEHKDGSLSDTYIQVDLRMQADGVHELQTSESHNWAIFVNQVGEDAFIAADEVRCIASGFKWNPYLVQDDLETYPNFCNRDEQLACAMGDLGMRHGLLTVGPNNRRVFSDANLPLVGNYSIMGRSLIVFDNKRPTVKLACANIFPDIHVKSNVVIKRTPSFTVSRFVEQMRSLLGAADWIIVPELKATKPVANGECVQMTIHFYGQRAHQMQIELNNLITLGTVRKSTRVGVDKISTYYKLCRAGEMQVVSSALGITLNTYLTYLYMVALGATATMRRGFLYRSAI